MANPSGKNSPSSFDEFTPTKPYGSVERQRALQKAAPVARLGTYRAAADAALAARPAPAAQVEPLVPSAPVPAVQDPVAAIWQAVAAEPGASALVKAYAARVA